MELLLTGTVSEADHKVIVARIDVIGNLNIDSCVVLTQTSRNCVVAVKYPWVLWLFLRFSGAFRSSGAVGVVVEVIVNLDVVVAQFLIVGHDVVEGDDVSAVVLLAVNGINNDTLVADDGLLHVFLRIGCLAFSISDGHLKHIALFDVFSVNVNMYMKPVDIEHTDVFAIGFAIGFVLMMVLDVVME